MSDIIKIKYITGCIQNRQLAMICIVFLIKVGKRWVEKYKGE